MTAKTDRAAEPPMTDEERKRRLGAVYAILLDLAARQRRQVADLEAQTADQQPPTEASYRHDDIRPAHSA